MLLADDTTQLIAYGRKTEKQAAIVIVNRSDTAQNFAVPVAGYLPNGITLRRVYLVGSASSQQVTTANGNITGNIGPLSAVILLNSYADIKPPAAPTDLHVTDEGDGTVSLAWNSASGAAGYTLYRSPLSGGGWVAIGTGLTGTSYTDNGLINGMTYYYAVTASDGAGNESGYSNEVSALPHVMIGWANLQWPPTLNHTLSPTNRTDDVYGQVWIDGLTNQPGPTPSLRAQLGFGPEGSNPDGNSDWTWVNAVFNTDAGNNDEFKASLLPTTTGSFDYVYRYSTTNGLDWLYADLNGPIPTGNLPSNPGKLTVTSSGDLTPPDAPTGLSVTNAKSSRDLSILGLTPEHRWRPCRL